MRVCGMPMGGDKLAIRNGLTSPAAIRLMTASSNRRMGFGSDRLSIVVDCMPSICNDVTRKYNLKARRGTLHTIRLEHVIAFGKSLHLA